MHLSRIKIRKVDKAPVLHLHFVVTDNSNIIKTDTIERDPCLGSSVRATFLMKQNLTPSLFHHISRPSQVMLPHSKPVELHNYSQDSLFRLKWSFPHSYLTSILVVCLLIMLSNIRIEILTSWSIKYSTSKHKFHRIFQMHKVEIIKLQFYSQKLPSWVMNTGVLWWHAPLINEVTVK